MVSERYIGVSRLQLRALLVAVIAIIFLIPVAHSSNCCVGSVGSANANLRIDSFNQKTVSWSLSVPVTGNWVNRTLLGDVDANGEGNFHLFDTSSTYDAVTNTTTFYDSAHDTWTRAPPLGAFPNETWYLNLYLGINASIGSLLNGRQQYPQLTTPNYNGNYSGTLMYCISDSTKPRGAYCYSWYGGAQRTVDTPFDLPRGYFMPWVYNVSIFVWRNPDIVQQLNGSLGLIDNLTYFVYGLISIPIAQVIFLAYSYRKNLPATRVNIIEGTFFTIGIGILLFLPAYVLELNPLTFPILNSPIQSRLIDLTKRVSLILIAGFVVFIFSKVLEPPGKITQSSGLSDQENQQTVMSAPQSSGPVQAPANAIDDLIERVDREFSQWKSPTLYAWLLPVILLFIVSFVVSQIYLDLVVRISITAAVIALILALTQILLDQFSSWIANANYRKIGRGQQDPLLYALILMKTAQPGIKLHDAQRMNPALFEREALIAKLYQ